MARGKSVAVGQVTFPNQTLALTFFKEMLNRYIPGERVSETDAVHLSALFERHPDYAEKSKGGIARFEVTTGDYGTQCFCAVSTSGVKEGFSYKRCVTQRLD